MGGEKQQEQQCTSEEFVDLNRNGNTSSRRNGLGIPKSSFSRIIRKDLNFHPYVLIRRQKLHATDPAQRLTFCQRFLKMNAHDPQFVDNLITSDEAVFSMKNEVNTKNVICNGHHFL